MRRDEFITELAAAFDGMITPLQSLPPELCTEPMEAGKWSLRELAAHFIFWDRIAVQALEATFRGEELDWLAYSDWDGLNRRAVEEMRDSPLKRVTAAWQITHSAFEEAFSRVPEERVVSGGEIAAWLRENVSDHYSWHAAQVKTWLERMTPPPSRGEELPILG